MTKMDKTQLRLSYVGHVTRESTRMSAICNFTGVLVFLAVLCCFLGQIVFKSFFAGPVVMNSRSRRARSRGGGIGTRRGGGGVRWIQIGEQIGHSAEYRKAAPQSKCLFGHSV